MNALPISGILLLSAASLLSSADRVIQFNRDVRPILSDKCYSCHGPDAVAKGIPRRLDSEASAKAERAGKRAIVDGDPDASPLIHRITSKDPNIRMPAASSGLKLNNQEIETLRTWITQGAKWEKHWSLIPPARPELPVVKTTAWPRNPIDFFVLERLEREDLRPSPEASRETLLRRVTLDLTGLPPSPGEIDAFLRDKSDSAYERVVDRLLESPRYGERMAARWLDAARYADTNGYQYDGERVMWRWRDWVIGSFNRNQPFDQFALEQIAGDLLPNATLEQKIATGFNRNHRANTEDGLIPEEYAVEYVVDRVETTSTVFLGLTLGCARCHNHKYDPLTQKEFYQVFAYFNNIPERGRAMKSGNSPPVVAAPTAEQQLQLEAIEKRIAAEQAALVGQADSLPRRAWEQSLSKSPPIHWVPSAGLTAAFSFEKENAWKAVGGAASLQPGRFGSAVSLDGKTYIDCGNIAGFDIEDRFSLSAWVYSDSVPNGSVVTKMADNPKGRGYGLHLNNGKVSAQLTTEWTTDAIRLESEETLQAKRWYHLMLTYDGSRMAEGVSVYIDGMPAKVKVEQDNLYRPFKNAGKAFKDPLRIGGGAGPDKRFQGLMDEVRIYGRILSHGFLPSKHQAVKFRSGANPVLYLNDPDGYSTDARRRFLDDLGALNELKQKRNPDPEISTRIAQYETAFRMQRSVPALVDLAKEPESVFEMYGPDARKPGTYAANCILARRLAERGVRFIQLFHRGLDHHGNLPRELRPQCEQTDQPTAALIRDLKQRGMLDETLIVWGGEFGRTVYSQGTLTESDYGRDHHPRCFAMWLAGGGIKGGITYGETDDYSYNIVKDPVDVHDLHATILHCLGIDHTRLTFKFQGRNYRLTDVHGKLVREIVA